MTSVAHLDGSGMKDALDNMIKAVKGSTTDHGHANEEYAEKFS